MTELQIAKTRKVFGHELEVGNVFPSLIPGGDEHRIVFYTVVEVAPREPEDTTVTVIVEAEYEFTGPDSHQRRVLSFDRFDFVSMLAQ